MTFAEIRHALETAPLVPEAALRDARAHAAELTPLVVELIEKLKAGVYLLPEEAQLLFYGAHVLAAERAAALWPAWCDLLRLPAEQTADLFGGDHNVGVLAAITASLVGDDAPAIVELLETPDVSQDVRWALFPVLARLTWEGHADLAGTRALLVRFAREELAEPDDEGWHGWVEAAALLGLVDLTPMIEEVFAKPAFDHFSAANRRETMERLAAAAADFADEDRFRQDHIAPFDDPVEGLWWLLSLQAYQDKWLAEHVGDEIDEPPDPAAGTALTAHEEAWLRGFLESPQVPPTTMNLEALDGFFCALVVGPGTVMPSEFMPYIWGGGQRADGLVYDSEAQGVFVVTLLMRYWTAIAQRIADGVGHEPFLFAADEADRGWDWAAGFGSGILLREAEWAPLLRHRTAGRLIAAILALDESNAGPEDELSLDTRGEILDELPDMLLAIAAVRRRAGQEPRRSGKIGRNQPCPCGSGRKYKKCCGANPPPGPR